MNIFKQKHTSVFFVFCLFFLTVISQANTSKSEGYEIHVEVENLERGDTIILAHYFNTNVFPNDTIALNRNGAGTFSGEKPLPGGMYMLFIPKNQMRFEFLLDKNQSFNIYADVNDPENLLRFENSPINKRFVEYQKTLQQIRRSKEALEAQKIKDEDTEDKDQLDKEIKAINESVQDYMKSVKEENKDNFLGTFLYAISDIDVPDFPRDEDGNILDSAFQYRYIRNHYFDNFNISDSRLLRTPVYENKIMRYLHQIVPQHPDTLIKEVDYILGESKKDSSVYRFNLVRLFNHYAKSKIMGMDAVHVHIGENYYIPDASWSSEDFMKKLKTYIEEVKPTLIGNTAPDFEMLVVPDEHFKAAANDSNMKNNVHTGNISTLHQTKAPFTILIFWEKDCGHCRKAVNTLHSEWNEKLKEHDVAVIAFHTLFGKEGKNKWIDYVNEKELYGWINAWYPYGYDFKTDYNLKSTPQIFIFDEDKKIVAKRIGAEQSSEIVLNLIERKNRKKNKQKNK